MQSLMNNTALTMTSREVAELTGKQHGHVLRDIDALVESLNPDLVLGFTSTTYVDSTGKSNRMYQMDRDSSICLVSGYDANSRMRIIKRWQELEAAPVPTSAEALHHATGLLLEQDKRQRAIEARQDIADDRLKRIESRQQAFEDGAKYFTVLGFAVWKALPPIDIKTAARIGKMATKLSKEAGVPIDRVPDPRFGVVNSYHESMLNKALAQFIEEA
jgi:Rha family phage regulatory protein